MLLLANIVNETNSKENIPILVDKLALDSSLGEERIMYRSVRTM